MSVSPSSEWNLTVSRKKILVSGKCGELDMFSLVLVYLRLCASIMRRRKLYCGAGVSLTFHVVIWRFKILFCGEEQDAITEVVRSRLMMYYIFCGLNRRLTTPTFGTEQLSEYFLHRTETICVWFRQFCTGVVFYHICFQQSI